MVSTQGSPYGQRVAQSEWQWDASTWQKTQIAAMAHPPQERDWESVSEAVCVPLRATVQSIFQDLCYPGTFFCIT